MDNYYSENFYNLTIIIYKQLSIILHYEMSVISHSIDIF